MKYVLTGIVLFTLTIPSLAQDRMFAYTYQTNVLNKGDFDIEFQNTLRTGKMGAYSPYIFGQHLDQRLELEFGLGKNVQTSFYFNSELFHYADTSSEALNQELKVSFSNEWKWKLSDPVANKIGSALYAELELGGSNVEFEGKLILDKRLRNELFAFNLAGKYEIEKEIYRENNTTKSAWTHNSPVELYFGYMHFLKPQIGIGFEIKNNNDITREDGWRNSVLFGGPSLFISAGKFFTTLSVLPQFINFHTTSAAPGKRDRNDFEAMEFRILAGFDF
ncbi:MAG: hypothetical protein Q8941_13635 [Bacteroidota bacterium]|nr:hypothetical protein [Bacteroidota bacterium]